MKFVCMKCETYMNFEKVEKPSEGSLGVFFGCPACGAATQPGMRFCGQCGSRLPSAGGTV